MASVNPYNDEEEKQPGQPVTTGGAGGAGQSNTQNAGVATSQSPVQQNAAPQNNQGYVDVASYLDANKSGSADLGNRVASNLTNKYNDTKTGVEQSAQNVKDAASKGYTQENTELIRQVASNPVQMASKQGTADQVQAQLNDTYTGPTNWADQGTQQGKVNEATQYGNLANTPGGLNVYAQEVEGQTGGAQSQGINQLDSLLLGGSPEAMGTVKAAADPYQSLNDFIHQQNMGVTSAIQGGQQAASTAQAHARDALLGPNGATAQIDQQVQNQLQAAIQQGTASNAEIKNAVSKQDYSALVAKGVLTQQQANDLANAVYTAQNSQFMSGHNFGHWSETTNVDLNNYLNQLDPNAQYNASNVATADQAARAQALQQLVGEQNYKSQLDPTLAGTAPKSLSVLDYLDATKDAGNFGKDARAAAQAQADAETKAADDAHNASKGGFLGKVKKVATLANPVAVLGNTAVYNKLKEGYKNV